MINAQTARKLGEAKNLFKQQAEPLLKKFYDNVEKFAEYFQQPVMEVPHVDIDVSLSSVTLINKKNLIGLSEYIAKELENQGYKIKLEIKTHEDKSNYDIEYEYIVTMIAEWK